SDVDADLAALTTDRARAQATIASYLGNSVDASRIVASTDTTAADAQIPSVDALVERALMVRGELRAINNEADAARLAVQAADRPRLPEPEIIAGTKTSSLQGGDIRSDFPVHADAPVVFAVRAHAKAATAP